MKLLMSLLGSSLLLLSGPAFSQQIDKIQAFIQSLASRYPAALVRRIEEDYQNARHKPQLLRMFITASLRKLEPRFDRAMRAFLQEYNQRAQSQLEQIIQQNHYPYLQAQSYYLLAKVHLFERHYLLASKALEQVVTKYGKYSPQVGSACLQLALCYLKLGQLEPAQHFLRQFLQKYPQAPEQQRGMAQQLLQRLVTRRRIPLFQLADKMKNVATELAQGNTGPAIQKQQAAILAALARLLQQAQQPRPQSPRADQQAPACSSANPQTQQQSQGSPTSSQANATKPAAGQANATKLAAGQASGKSQSAASSRAPAGAQCSSSPAGQAFLPSGQPAAGPQVQAAKPAGGAWGYLPAKQRHAILQLLHERFPERYRRLLQSYYQQLGKSK